MSKHEAPPFRMVVENGRLVPATAHDAERLDSYRRGTKVKVRLTEEKDRILVRKWWAVLGLVIKQCKTPWKNKDQASEAIKLALGIVNLSKTVTGTWMQYPKSLTELEDPELEEAVDQMMELLQRMTGVDPDTLRREAASVGAEEDHDPETGEVIEANDNSNTGPDTSQSDPVDAAPLSPSEPASEPGDSLLPSPGSTIDPQDLVHARDFARKALDTAVSDLSEPAKLYDLEGLVTNYRAALSEPALIDAIMKAVHPVMSGKRSREQAEDYIARDVLGCPIEDLRIRK